MQEIQNFSLFRTMLEEGYTVEQAQKIIGLSDEETELYLGLLERDGKITDFNTEKMEEEQKKAM